MTRSAFGQAQFAHIAQGKTRGRKFVVWNPGVVSSPASIDVVRNATDPGCINAGYISIRGLLKEPKENPFHKAHQAAMLKHCYKSVMGQILEFGAGWAHIKHSDKNADRLVDFIRTSPELRQFDTLYLDEGNLDLPKWCKDILEAHSLTCTPVAHTKYVHRVIEGLADMETPTGSRMRLIVNSAGDTIRAADKITVEASGGMEVELAQVACNTQSAVGRGGIDKNVIWYHDTDGPTWWAGEYV